MRRSLKKHKLFNISKPYGYHPEQVEKAIEKYNEVLTKLQDAVTYRDNIIRTKDEELMQVKSELQRMQLEMSMLELPKMDQLQEHMILTQFKEKKTKPNHHIEDDYIPNPVPELEEIQIPVVGSDSTELKQKGTKDELGFEIVE